MLKGQEKELREKSANVKSLTDDGNGKMVNDYCKK